MDSLEIEEAAAVNAAPRAVPLVASRGLSPESLRVEYRRCSGKEPGEGTATVVGTAPTPPMTSPPNATVAAAEVAASPPAPLPERVSEDGVMKNTGKVLLFMRTHTVVHTHTSNHSLAGNIANKRH